VSFVGDRGPQSAFLDEIGAEVEEWREGYVRMSLRVEERHMNLYGGMHGGVATSMMDELTGGLIASVRGIEVMEETPHSTVEMSVSFIGGVGIGDDLVFEGKVIRVGRSVAFAEAHVRKRGEERRVASGKFTYVIMQPRSTV
jgi:uncharacterized protein (TIGR00369 family)